MEKSKITIEVPGKETKTYETEAFIAVIAFGEADQESIACLSGSAITASGVILAARELCKKTIAANPPIQKLFALQKLIDECEQSLEGDSEDDDDDEDFYPEEDFYEDDEVFDI